MACAEVGNGFSEGLVRLYNGQVKPGMAKSWDISKDGKTYTFHLRDAKWNDGQPVTAQNFEYGIKRLMDPKLAAAYAFAGSYIVNATEYNTGKITDASKMGVKAIDDKTLQITLKNATPYFLGYLSNDCFHASRQDLVEKYGNKYGTDVSTTPSNGPFILKSWKHDDSLTLEKNPDYWDKDSIKLEKVIIKVIKDPQTAFNLYNSGELDFVDVPSQLSASYIASGQAKVYMTGADDYLLINTKAAGKPWLANNDFRQAMNYALNRKDYVKLVFHDLYLPATRLMMPLVAGIDKGKFNDQCKIDQYSDTGDAAKAQELLKKAMTTLNITDPKQITFSIKTSDDDTAKKQTEVIQDQLNKTLGINVTIKMVTYKQMLADNNNKNYETITAGWMPDYDDPMTYLELFQTGNSSNSSGYSNPAFDKDIESARTEPDAAKRQQLLYGAEKMLINDCPLLPLQYRQSAWMYKSNLKNLQRYFVGSDIDFTYAYFG